MRRRSRGAEGQKAIGDAGPGGSARSALLGEGLERHGTNGDSGEAGPDVRQPDLHERQRGAPDRLDLLWSAKRWLILPVLAIGGLTLAGSSFLPPTYESTAQVQVALPLNPASPRETILASNELAGQYARLIPSEPVTGPAAQRAGEPGAALRDAVSASAQADSNIVRIRAQAGSADVAASRAQAVAESFVAYMATIRDSQAAQARRAAAARLRPFDNALAEAQRRLRQALGSGASDAVVTTRQQLVNTLLVQREALRGQLSGASGPTQPDVAVWANASQGVRVQPKPALFALVAMGLTLLFVSQTIVFLARRGMAFGDTQGSAPSHGQRK